MYLFLNISFVKVTKKSSVELRIEVDIANTPCLFMISIESKVIQG